MADILGGAPLRQLLVVAQHGRQLQLPEMTAQAIPRSGPVTAGAVAAFRKDEA